CGPGVRRPLRLGRLRLRVPRLPVPAVLHPPADLGPAAPRWWLGWLPWPRLRTRVRAWLGARVLGRARQAGTRRRGLGRRPVDRSPASARGAPSTAPRGREGRIERELGRTVRHARLRPRDTD